MELEESLILLMIGNRDSELHKIYSIVKHMERKFGHLSNSEIIGKLLLESFITKVDASVNTEYKLTEKGQLRIQAIKAIFWDECIRRFPQSAEFIEYLRHSLIFPPASWN